VHPREYGVELVVAVDENGFHGHRVARLILTA
jgi:hypothetical protein